MYDTILRIAHDIVLLGGALLMILSVIVMLMLIGITSKIHKMVSKSMETVSLISQYVVLPFTYLSSLLGGLSGGEREVTKKKVSTAKKK